MDKVEIINKIAEIRNKLCGAKGIMDLLSLGKEIDSSFLELAKEDFSKAIKLLKELEP